MKKINKVIAKIIAIVGQKGGIGKTTIALNFLIKSILEERISTTLIDCDNDQFSSFIISEKREKAGLMKVNCEPMKASELLTHIETISKNNERLFIECGGRNDEETEIALQLADLILMPSPAGALEVNTFFSVENLIRKAGCENTKALIIPNRISSHPKDPDLKEMLDLQPRLSYFKFTKNHIKDRRVYSRSFKNGKGIIEVNPKNRNAEFELDQVYQETIYGK